MAVPTINTVSPQVGATGGGNLVAITGTNFRLWTIPPATGGPAGALTPTVSVLFGGVESPKVIVASATRLFARAPRTPMAAVEPDHGEGAVDIEVRNISGGVLVPGESAVAASAYTYRRVQLAVESDLTRLCRSLLREFKVQVLANALISTHTDWEDEVSEEGINTLGLATLPGIALLGPELTENRFYSVNQRRWQSVGGIESVLRRVPYTVDLTFTLVGICTLRIQAINLMAVVQSFFELNKRVSMHRNAADPSAGTVSYDLELLPDGDAKMDSTPNESNLHSFSGRFAIRGFDIQDLAGFDGSQVISRTAAVTEEPELLIEQKAEESS